MASVFRNLTASPADSGQPQTLLSHHQLLLQRAPLQFVVGLAREALGTNWGKLEVIGDERTQWPDVTSTV